MLKLKKMSFQERKVLVEDLRRKRCEARPPYVDALRTLCIEAVAKNYEGYVDRPENPLKNLPNNLVQLFFKMLIERTQRCDYLIPSAMFEDKFVRLLLDNPNVTEFDVDNNRISSFEDYCENCPDVSKIIKSGDGRQKVPFMVLVKWSKLTCIDMKGYNCTDETFGLIQKHLPQIRQLKFTVCSKSFSMIGADHLTKMQKLEELAIFIDIDNDKNLDSIKADVLVYIAGKCSRLHTLTYIDGRNNNDAFVEQFRDNFPNKKLLVPAIWVTYRFAGEWPSNLMISQLNILGNHMNVDGDAEYILRVCGMALPVKDIILKALLPSRILKVLRILGHQITSLEIPFFKFGTKIFDELDGEEFKDFGLHQIMAACPKLESLSISESFLVVLAAKTGSTRGLTPEHFKNIKSFPAPSEFDSDSAEKYITSIYKMFLVGTKACRKLVVPSSDSAGMLMRILGNVLVKDPNCLDKLQEITLDYSHENALCGVSEVIDISTNMILHSPYLEQIEIITSNMPMVLDINKHHSYFKEFIEETGVRFVFLDTRTGHRFQLGGLGEDKLSHIETYVQSRDYVGHRSNDFISFCEDESDEYMSDYDW